MPRIEVRKRNSSDLDGSTAPLRFFLGLSFNVKTMYNLISLLGKTSFRDELELKLSNYTIPIIQQPPRII